MSHLRRDPRPLGRDLRRGSGQYGAAHRRARRHLRGRRHRRKSPAQNPHGKIHRGGEAQGKTRSVPFQYSDPRGLERRMSAAWGRVRGLAKYLGAQQSSAGKMITLLSIIALGFFLGMRHATDPDHVIAVTTIVSRQRSIRHAALIGILWGMGHTITIFLVGSAIILFGIVIPARVGLTMELSVGLMLILLGILNLSGMMRWITETLTPSHYAFHSHPHGHGDYVHSHPHGHSPEKHGHAEDATPVGCMDRLFGRLGIYQVVRPLAVG